ncbi:hypothetical protein KY284_001380 [Solanum tuberosum]|nr:hypothetical protein KY284_001380 [Solanum tuberosum]
MFHGVRYLRSSPSCWLELLSLSSVTAGRNSCFLAELLLLLPSRSCCFTGRSCWSCCLLFSSKKKRREAEAASDCWPSRSRCLPRLDVVFIAAMVARIEESREGVGARNGEEMRDKGEKERGMISPPVFAGGSPSPVVLHRLLVVIVGEYG